jgi:hypothetical protein
MNTSPKVSDTERMLQERAKRFAEPLPPLLVYAAGNHLVQLPHELSMRLIHNRRTVPIADLTAVPKVVLSEDDVDSELEAQLFTGARA